MIKAVGYLKAALIENFRTNNKIAADLTGINEADINLIEDYVKALETGPTSDHCLCEWSEVQPGRKIRTSVNMACPVHTREGLLLGFLKHTRNVLQDKEMIQKHEVTSIESETPMYMEGLPLKPATPTETRPVVAPAPTVYRDKDKSLRKVEESNVRFIDENDDLDF